MPKPKVLIGIPCHTHMHAQCVFNLVRLADKCKTTGLCDFEYAILWRWQWLEMRSKFVQLAMEWNCDHILVLDPDLLYPDDILHRLMAHDKEIVAGLYFKRNAPPVTPNILNLVEDGPKKVYKEVMNYEKGLIRVDAVGMGMTLIRSELFRKIKPPWFVANYPEFSEDVYFCLQAMMAGYKVWADTNLVIGHIFSGPVAVGEHTFLKGEFKY